MADTTTPAGLRTPALPATKKKEKFDLSDSKAWVTKRPRVPHSSAIIEVVIRFIGLGLAVALLTLCTGLAVQFCEVYIAVIVNGCLCFVVDLVEIVPLLDASRNIRRLRSGLMCIMEIPVIVSCVVAGFQAYSGAIPSGEEDRDTPLPPDSKWKNYILTVVVVVGIWRLFMMLFVCVGVCWVNRREIRARRELNLEKNKPQRKTKTTSTTTSV